MNRSAVEAGVVTKTLMDEELHRTCDESAKIKAAFGHFFDLTIINDNLDETYRTVKAALETVSKNPQWVPVTWVF
ncbi:PREDICTED: MAGUK p55 subfamily member 2-like [Cyprinodon variegatus]|uniref:MAGUK p55 subfamily member 2-like n=1 Tax=Cyprinodon variegatus TaxID=28743 RepID=UPI0007427C88|nr:PREDICTED: MAGUK p55 subfamily member 2-like [Cyprinodon variegatus]